MDRCHVAEPYCRNSIALGFPKSPRLCGTDPARMPVEPWKVFKFEVICLVTIEKTGGLDG